MENITTLLVALMTGVGASTITALLSRPKTKAEANVADANASVAISAEARQWAQIFIGKANDADAKAAAAEERADVAEDRANAAETRADAAEKVARRANSRADRFERQIAVLTQAVRDLGGDVAEDPQPVDDAPQP